MNLSSLLRTPVKITDPQYQGKPKYGKYQTTNQIFQSEKCTTYDAIYYFNNKETYTLKYYPYEIQDTYKLYPQRLVISVIDKNLSHYALLKLINATFEDNPSAFVIVTEKMEEKTLQEKINLPQDQKVPLLPTQIKEYFADIVNALEYLEQNEVGSICLDASCIYLKPTSLLFSGYAIPEFLYIEKPPKLIRIFNKVNENPKEQYFQLGLLLYQLTYLKQPFSFQDYTYEELMEGENFQKIYDNIEFNEEKQELNQINKAIKALLDPNIERRISHKEALILLQNSSQEQEIQSEEFQKEAESIGICKAAGENNFRVLKYLIESKNSSPDTIDSNNQETPLTISVQYNHFNIVKYLIETAKANPNFQNKYQFTPIMIAIRYNRFEMVKYFIDVAKADPNLSSEDGWNPIIMSAEKNQLQTFKYLTEVAKADPCFKKPDGWNALFLSCQNGHFEIVQHLVDQYQQDPNSLDKNNTTPLMMACLQGHIDIVKYLITKAKADPNLQNNKGWNCVMKAIEKGHFELFKYLVEEANGNCQTAGALGETPIVIACQNGHFDILKYLIQNNLANPNAKDPRGLSLLMLSGYFGHFEMLKYLVQECHLDVNEKTENGMTPLVYSCQRMARGDCYEIAKFLIEVGKADINAVDAQKNNVLLLSAQKGSLEAVKYLIEDCSMDSGVRNLIGQTPLDMAQISFVKNDSLIDFLRSLQ